MVLRWGMSEKLGPISFVAPHDDGLPPAFQRQPYSEATAELIDAEVRRIVEECQGEATRLLAAHRDQLVALATALLQAESPDEDVDEPRRRLAVRIVAHALEDFEPAARDGLVGSDGVAHGNERIPGTPDDERRYLGGQIQPVGGAHRLSAQVDDGAQGAKEGPAAIGVGERRVAPP